MGYSDALDDDSSEGGVRTFKDSPPMRKPSGALVKALLIHGASTLTYWDYEGASSDDTADDSGGGWERDGVARIGDATVMGGTESLELTSFGTTSNASFGALPDASQGFGRVNLDSIVLDHTSTPYGSSSSSSALSSRRLGLWVREHSLASGESISFKFHVISGEEPFKATLTWYDPPNSYSAAKQLLHDFKLVSL